MICKKSSCTKISCTKNVEGNRKILLAQCEVCGAVFEIPDGLDLGDETVVKEFDVRECC